jgi:hypothetical protein
MGILLLIAMIACIGAFGYGAFAALALSIMALQSLIKRRFKQAAQYLSLLVLAASTVLLSSYLFNSQPVEWPFSPAHIPLYIACILLSHLALQVLPKKWISEVDAV